MRDVFVTRSHQHDTLVGTGVMSETSKVAYPLTSRLVPLAMNRQPLVALRSRKGLLASAHSPGAHYHRRARSRAA